MATHPVGPAGSINVNTAPLPLIEAAMLIAGRGGIETIMAARREGIPAPLPAALTAEPSSRFETNQTPRFVAVSNSWAARIDVHVGAARRSWWVVYQNRSARWECVQRLVITD